MHHFPALILNWVQLHIYLGTVLFMAMESSVLPVPSELVIPPAAYIAYTHSRSVGLIMFAGTFGSWLGSAVMYWLSRGLGRVVVVKFGGYAMITEQKLERAEHWLHRYEAGGIFFARLLPVIRHLISIPAGIIRMNFGLFSAMTVAGSAIWCSALAFYGMKVMGTYAEQHPGWTNDPAGLLNFMKEQSHWLVGGVLVLGFLYFIFIWMTAKPEPASPRA